MRVVYPASTTTTNYLYERQSVAQEVSPSGEARVLNGVGLDERYARVSAAGVVSWFLVDRLGSTVALTDSTGLVQLSYVYGPFGNTRTVAGTQTSNDNAYQFTGREGDPAVGVEWLAESITTAGDTWTPGLRDSCRETPRGSRAPVPRTFLRGDPSCESKQRLRRRSYYRCLQFQSFPMPLSGSSGLLYGRHFRSSYL